MYTKLNVSKIYQSHIGILALFTHSANFKPKVFDWRKIKFTTPKNDTEYQVAESEMSYVSSLGLQNTTARLHCPLMQYFNGKNCVNFKRPFKLSGFEPVHNL